MNELRTDNLRILLANERRDRLALVAMTVAALGHEVVAQETDLELREASKRGVFAFVTGGGDWQSTIDMALRRYSDYRELERAFRRVTTIAAL